MENIEQLKETINKLEKRNEYLIKRSKEKIEELESEINSSKNIELYKAIFEVKNKLKVSKNGKVGTNGYGYTYFKIEDIFIALDPLLEEHGLLLDQYPAKNGTVVTTRFIHIETGQKTPLSELKILLPPNKNNNVCQSQGSGVTYAKRYSVTLMLGLVIDEDTDGN